MSNTLARHVLEKLFEAGVREAVICPGGRNAAFVELFAGAESPIKPFWHFEERTAAFFGLGRVKQSGRPVAVITTSGTAAGELWPATMEAYYSGLPLVLVTADRPKRFRGSGSPQSADQSGMFRHYAPMAFDLEGEDEVELFDLRSNFPAHLNVCFEDPHGEPAQVESGTQVASLNPSQDLREFLDATRRPLVVVGALVSHDRPAVTEFLLKLDAATYFEAQSGLRESQTLTDIRLVVADGIFDRARKIGEEFDALLRIGGVPTHRLWRDLEDRSSKLPVLSVSSLPFSGLGRASTLCSGDTSSLLRSVRLTSKQVPKELQVQDRDLSKSLLETLESEPLSEPGMIHALSLHIEPNAAVFVGNSLPIRQWDLAATTEPRGLEVSASRGLNGIDGQVSTFLGMCEKNRPNWAVLGDLTALYDLPGPWIGRQLDPEINATIVVINNSGGRIFERMFPQSEFLNPHDLDFENWAKMWSLDYQRCPDVSQIKPSKPGLRVIELRPDSKATRRFWTWHAEAMN